MGYIQVLSLTALIPPQHRAPLRGPLMPTCPHCGTTLQLHTGPQGAQAAGWERGCCLRAGVSQITSGAISAGEVSSLDHEVLDHTVKLAALEAESFLGAGRERRE